VRHPQHDPLDLIETRTLRADRRDRPAGRRLDQSRPWSGAILICAPGSPIFGALMRSARRAIRGKTGPVAAAFMAGLETEVLRLERELLVET